MRCEDVRQDLAAYSLDALEESERAAIEAHLDHCAACAAEAAALAEVAAGLAQLVPPATPSPALRARLLARAAANDRGRALSSEPPASRGASRTGSLRPAFASQEQWGKISPLSALAAAIVVGLLAWAIALQVQLNHQNERLAALTRRAERYEQVVSVLMSTELRVRDLAGTEAAPEARGRLVIDPDGGMLMVWNLPPVPEDRAYQVWFVSEEARFSAALIRPDEDGSGYFFINVPPDLPRYQTVGLTEEPASGSPGPTGRRVLGGPL